MLSGIELRLDAVIFDGQRQCDDDPLATLELDARLDQRAVDRHLPFADQRLHLRARQSLAYLRGDDPVEPLAGSIGCEFNQFAHENVI